jgi:hypothetical protein
MERLMDLHIKEGPLKDYPLKPMQHAYLKGKSTETALHDLVYKIDGSVAQKEFALGVFLDVEGAFDNTSLGFDSSLFEGRAGSGVFFSEKLDLKASFALGTFATVFQAEVYAIMACSDYCLKECMTGKTICICSDRAALLALNSHTVLSRLVLQYRDSLQGLSIQNRVQLF